MKRIIFTSILTSTLTFTALPVFAQTDAAVVTQSINVTKLISILNNATVETSSEQLQSNLVSVIKIICREYSQNRSDQAITGEHCNATEIDNLITNVVAAIGADSPFIDDFLAALVNAGANPDEVTLAAITGGIDATIASEATAAGPASQNSVATAPVIVTLPNTSIPLGSGGTGGDSGISETQN
ncbi:hypothetical protein [Pseudoalteromonas mariniglutinosa]|uniref:hypothetical protein n=1 Tax=Pseudoalteromonas mariniglutinosa TaxID=206042 RepID=UPI003850AECD